MNGFNPQRPSARARRPLCAFILLLLLFTGTLTLETVPASPSGPGAGSRPLELLRITPSGEDVPTAGRITFEFNQPMAALGRMEREPSEVPIRLDPPVSCQWQWLNETTLSCRLREQDRLRPATRYHISLSPHLSSLAGSQLGREISHSFLTERPSITGVWFREWTSPQRPVFYLQCNQPVSEETLQAHLYFLARGKVRIPAAVEPPPETPSLAGEKDRQWLVSPRAELPQDAPVELWVEPGIASLLGPEKGQENRAINAFHTLPAFAFLGMDCVTLKGQRLRIPPSTPTQSIQRCDPTQEVNLLFSSPVLPEALSDEVTLTTTGPKGGPFPNLREQWQDLQLESRRGEPGEKGKTYPLPLPRAFVLPHAGYQLKIPVEGIHDEFGRRLAAPVAFAFQTDHLPPDFALVKSMPVLEKGLDTEAHVWAVNLQEASVRYEALTSEGPRVPSRRLLSLPSAKDQVTPVPLGIRRVLAVPSGAVQGTLSSTPSLPGKYPQERWFFAQVTPFHVHVKLGHHKSLVWVTDLQSGLPVARVKVEIRRDAFSGLGEKQDVLAAGETDSTGCANLPGTADLDPELKLLWSYQREEPGLFVFCRKDEDLAVVPLRYDFQVVAEGANREYLPQWMRPRHGHLRAWGMTAQGVYKVGDTLQYKIYVRDQDNERFTAPPLSTYKLSLVDPMGKVVHERPDIQLSSFGTFHGEWTIPATGAVGHYRFVLTADFTGEQWEPLRVLVSDFTPSPFQVVTRLSGERFQAGDSVSITSEAHLHAGGPYTRAAVRVHARLVSQAFQPENPRIKGYVFDSVLEGKAEETPSAETVLDVRGELDARGEAHWDFQLPGSPIVFGSLDVESAVSDEGGRSVAGTASVPYAGRDRYVGLLQEDWTLQENRPASLSFAVVDPDGRLLPEVKATFRLQSRRTVASRVKGPGDAYLTQYLHEWEDEETREVVSMEEPVSLEFMPRKPGVCRISMEISDSAGRSHSTVLTRWVVGQEQVVWETLPGYTLNVFPEKADLRVGETARFLVQNPFPGAQALISVERYGILQSWVRALPTATEVVEFPVTPEHLPGFYFSIVVASPRVDKPVSPEGLDLGKPTFRMGYALVQVRDTHKEISVTAKPDREVYKPGEKVTVDLEARIRNPEAASDPPPMELAVAVLDESVFQLLHRGRHNFDPYGGFYRMDDLDVSNFNLLKQLVGREKLEKKGASAGGDGGPDLSLRSVFKFLCYWNPSLLPDADGRAQITFDLPDNLTAWRVLVLAVNPGDRMGLGDCVFRVNRPTEIRPVLPNQVLEGDRFDAVFTILNRSDRLRSLNVGLLAEGRVQSPQDPVHSNGPQMLSHEETLALEPFGRGTIRFPLRASAPGEILLTIRAGDDTDQDALQTRLKANPAHSLNVLSLHTTMEGSQAIHPVRFPADMRGDAGSLKITVSPSILGDLEGPLRHLRDYPYTCWEQKLSRGLMAAMYEPLTPYISPDFHWEGVAAAPNEVIASASEHQAPNGGMAYYIPEDEYVDPFLSAFTALGLHWLERWGYTVDARVSQQLDAYLEGLLRREIFPDFYRKEMAVSTRALALAALVQKGKAVREDVERLHRQVPFMDLFAAALYLETLTRLENTRDLQAAVLERILAHVDESGTTLTFTESADRAFPALLHSPIRANGAILSALLACLEQAPDDASLANLAHRLARTLKDGRESQGHWPSTQDNLFAMKALMDYGRAFEKASPDTEVQAWFDSEPMGHAHFTAFTQAPIALERSLRPEDVGVEKHLSIGQTGRGRLYYGITLSYAPRVRESGPVHNGLEIHREYSMERDGKWTLLQEPLELRTGDLVRVDLYVHVPAERHFVVVEDPVPGALEPVSRDLATSITVSGEGSGGVEYPAESHRHRFEGWIEPGPSRWNFYHRELRHEAVRFYSEKLLPGRYHLSYVAQAVASGEFQILPAHGEEMYHPNVHGKTGASSAKVRPAGEGKTGNGDP